MLELIISGIGQCLSPINIVFMFFSVTLGIIIGALPGFGASTGLIIVLPLTYTLDPGTAFVALTGVYVGAEYGGSISAILLNTPGTGAAVVTCFDGFPMAKAGKARDALLISNISSFFGGLVSALTMLFFMPLLAMFALQFGAGEIFILAVAGLFLVASVSKGDTIKGMLSAGLGVFVTCIGADSFMGYARFDFDVLILFGGIPFIPVMLGVFSVPHLLNMVLTPKTDASIIEFAKTSFAENFKIFLHYFKYLFSKCLVLLLRSSFIGVIIGMIPGVGASVATMVSYSTAKKGSKHPEEFGKGAIEGIAAPESSNNGLVGGSLIPVLALGIPGSPAAAIFMGAIFMHGMTPGPNFLIKQPDLVYLLIMAVLFCSIVQLFLGMVSIGSLANILKVSPIHLFPAVLVICSIGAYVVRGHAFDIYLFAGFGLAAYFLTPLGFNPAAFILGMILGNITERSFMESLTIAGAKGGIAVYLLSRELAMVMMALLGCYCLYCLWQWRKERARGVPEAVQKSAPKVQGGPAWPKMRMVDLCICVVLAAATAYAFYLTIDLHEKSSLFPRLLLTVIAFVNAALLVRVLFFGGHYQNSRKTVYVNVDWARLGFVLLVCAAYFFLLVPLGFYLASWCAMMILCLGLSYWEGGSMSLRKTLNNILYVCIFIGFAYGVFAKLFMVQAPLGIFV